MNTFKWLLKREFWENKGAFLWTPITIGVVMTGFIVISLAIALLGLSHGMEINGVQVNDLAKTVTPEQRAVFANRFVFGYASLTVPILVAFGFCGFFYCLSALYDERKDRSVLFWKSLPLSDRDTVLSKVAMAVVVAPLIALVIAIATAFVAGFVICIAAAIAGVNIFGDVLTNAATYYLPFQLLGVLPVYALWALPTVGWLLMVSAWARTKPLLWALGVPLLTGMLVSWANKLFGFDWNVGWFWKTILGRLLGSVIPGSWMGFVSQLPKVDEAGGPGTAFGIGSSASWGLLASPNIWIGAALGAAMIYAAIRLRGLRDEG
ncbi:MAG: hypothetical protein ABL931_17815 [Usitatibacteraceae bacterium]